MAVKVVLLRIPHGTKKKNRTTKWLKRLMPGLDFDITKKK